MLLNIEVETNTFMIDVDDDVNGDFTIWIDPHLVDVTQPIPFIVNGREVIVQVTPSEMSLWESTLKHGDPSFAYVAKVLYSQLCAAD